MALQVALNGTWTWDGTTTVLSDNTSNIVVGDWLRMDDDNSPFKITAITPNVNVTIENPDSLIIPSGTGASRDDQTIVNEIMRAGDVVENVTSSETITEPGAAPGTTRALVKEWSSATIHAGKKFRVTTQYMNGPESKAWCAARSAALELV